ncbi:hypothetical protein SAMN02910356_02085 [Selenomonas sp. GACV-9]|uniref:hypothetical protein n=1 Tax=Selenomonas sp. GACV-9 TaxID=3158782 RepID=UPI0008DF7CF8|nr:hypothetical protein SAMN02910356_02085 [Selenomonas ruminantium]
MSDDMNVPVVENGDVSQYKERNDEEADQISSFMDVLRSVPTKEDFDALYEKKAKMDRVADLVNEADAALKAENWDEALAKLDEALGYGLPSLVVPALKMKCFVYIKKGCGYRVGEEVKKASELFSEEGFAGLEEEIYTVIYDNVLKFCWENFNKIPEVKLCGMAEQLVPLENAITFIVDFAEKLSPVFQDEWLSARFTECARRKGWDIRWDSLVDVISQTCFDYTEAAQKRKAYADLLMPGAIAEQGFREGLDDIGKKMLKRMLDIAIDKEQKAGICEKLAMANFRSTDKTELCKVKDRVPGVREYFVMMQDLSPAYKQRYETLATQWKIIEKKVKAVNAEKQKINDEILELRREAAGIDREIDQLENGIFYWINLFARSDVSGLKDKKRIVEKCIAMRKRRLDELDTILAETA